MAELDLRALAATRAERDAADRRRQELDVRLAALERDLVARARAGDPGGIASTQERLAAARRERDEVDRARHQLDLRVRDLADGLLVARSHEQAVASLDGRVPVALLPVRIETRFGADRRSLSVRIFPDQVHIDAHDPALTEDEVAAGQWYWSERWPAPGDVERAEAAWQAVVARFRPGRARYFVDRLRPEGAVGGPGGPVFPEVERRAASWSRPPDAVALPERWVVVGYQQDAGGLVEVFRRWSDRVPDRLAAGPSPDAGPPAAPGELPADDGLAWTHDPAAAAEAGLLVTVNDGDLVGGRRLASGLARLVVLGVDWTLAPAEAAEALERLLADHGAAGSLALVPQGTPTNNSGASRSGFTTAPADAAAALAPHRPEAALDEWSAGPRLAAALGIEGAALARAPGADRREHAWSAALLDALWEATAGYYLGELLDAVATPQAVADLRQHAGRHLFASGPLPTLRVGAQPYGVLPVVASRRFQPAAEHPAESTILRVAGAFRELCEPLVTRSPHLRRAGERQEVDRTLLELLQRTPVTWTLRFRNLVGPVERKAMSVRWDQIAAFQQSYVAMVYRRLGVTARPRLQELTLDEHDFPLDVPLVARGDAGTAYVAEIAALVTARDGRRDLNLRQDSVALLEALLAFAACREIDRASANRLVDHLVATLPAEQLAQVALVAHRAVPAPDTVRVEAPTPASGAAGAFSFATPRQLADARIAPVTGNDTLAQSTTLDLAERLRVDRAGLFGAPTDPSYWLARFRAALDVLAAAPLAELEWALRGFLDLFATRLDAWYTSLASSRLARHRAARPTGVHLGCYGWVEQLAPEPGPESLGYVHAPSLAHATAAAVLRSGRLAHQDEQGRLFDIEITSSRTREALALLGGVAQGQPVGALLGYRIERKLRQRDLRLAQYILPLRLLAPLRHTDAELDEPVEAIAARDVVDGLVLLERWRTSGPALLADAAVAAGDRAAVGQVLDEVAGLYDAVSDIQVAEAVFQVAQGNLDRAGAALAAHDRQDRPVEPDVVRTPRSGATVTHRVAVVLQDPGPSGWPTDVRTAAEPGLDAWLGRLLGPPDRLVAAGRLVRGDGTATALAPVSLAELGLGATSAVLAAQRPGGDRPSELEERLALAFAAQVADAGPQDHVELLADAPEPDRQGLAVLRTLATWAASVLGAPAVSPADLGAVDEGRAATYDLGELAARADAVVATIASTRAGVAAAGPDPASLAARLLDAVPFAPIDAVPRVPTTHPDAATVLAEQAGEVQARLALLEAQVAELAAAPAPSDETPAAAVARLSTVVRAALGAGQPVLARFRLDDAGEVAASLADRAALTGGDDLAPLAWLHRAALVRPVLDPLASLLVHAEAGGDEVVDHLVVVQQPHRPGARWCALPFGPEGAPPAGTVGIVAVTAGPFDPTAPVAGLLVDGWTETIPQPVETTAVSFHYDAPGARAPQALLLAVHPAVAPDTWDLATLLDTVDEAIGLTRLRTLGPRELAGFAGFLPALYLPDNYTRDVPSVPVKDLLLRARAAGLATVASTVLGKG